MNRRGNEPSLRAARAALERKRKKNRDINDVSQENYFAACDVCQQMCVIRSGKRYDITDEMAWSVHKHQPKPLPVGWFKLGKYKLNAKDFTDT